MTMPGRLSCLRLVVVVAALSGGCGHGEPLPNGYAVFFASSSEAALVKDGVNYGACIAGPHVVELGSSGTAIFGRIEPKKGLPPHPDHAPGFFVIDSVTDKATTGLDRERWIAELKALGVDSPELWPPNRFAPRRY